MRRRSVAAAAAVVVTAGILAAQSTGAQVPGSLAVEVRGGAGIGAYEATAAGLEFVPRPAWGVAVSWGPSPALAGYVAYSAVGFGCADGFCQDGNVSFTSRGPSLGLRGVASVRGEPWLRGGLLLHGLAQRWTGVAGSGEATAEGGPGVEVAGGVTWRITDRLSVTPGLHIGFLPTTRESDGATENVVFSALDLGLRLGL
jgi:hypothetical protein